MTIKTDLGYIDITNEVLAGIAGYAASSCFGVKGMTIRSMSDGLAHLLGLENQSRGVKVTEAVDGGVNIDLHIAVEHGVNIATVCRSIIGEVRYHVERLTGGRKERRYLCREHQGGLTPIGDFASPLYTEVSSVETDFRYPNDAPQRALSRSNKTHAHVAGFVAA